MNLIYAPRMARLWDCRNKMTVQASSFSSTFASFTFSAQPAAAAAGSTTYLNQPKIKPYRNKVFIVPLQFFDIEGAPAAETLEFEWDKIAGWAVEVNAFLRFVSKLLESPRIILLTPFQISPSLVSPFFKRKDQLQDILKYYYSGYVSFGSCSRWSLRW